MGKRSKSEDHGNNDETRKERKLDKKLRKENKKKKIQKKLKKQKREAGGSNNDSSSVVVVKTELLPKQVSTDSKTTAASNMTSSKSQLHNAVSSKSPDTQKLHNKKGISPFHRKKARLLVSLLPASLKDIPRAINGAMQSLLLRYSDGIGGVLLSFDNIEIEDDSNRITAGGGGGSRYGIILDEMPHIHYYITSDILVFRPDIGEKITGVVNESFPSHLGILVYDFFNAMVSADSLRESGFLFDSDLNEWSQGNTRAAVQVEDALICKVEKIHGCNGMISLECSEPSIGVEAN